MKFTVPRVTITSKLSLLFFVFILIFYGTIVHVFFHIQKMMELSEEIVSINNVVANQAKVLIENLLEMDANAKKYSLLDKADYREYFNTAQAALDTGMTTINHLQARGYLPPAAYTIFAGEYASFQNNSSRGLSTVPAETIPWVDEDTVNTWLALLVQLREENQQQIETSLLAIHNTTLTSTRNGLLGFGLSVVTAFFSVVVVSKSILIPLKQLTHGLRTLSQGDYSNTIKVSSQDEFQDLAIAYNDMSSELREQENLRSDFIATLSHEIRTPLSSIQESVNMLTEELLGEINEKQRKFLTIASGELSRITDLLDHLMHVSRLETLPSMAHAEPVDVKALVLECVDALSTTAKNNNIKLQPTFSNDTGKAYALRNELQQILMNVIGNAVKFSPPQAPVRITVLKAVKSGYVQVQVADQGPGIREDELSLVFNKYYRSKAIRKHMDGVGLGLYISKRIIMSMGGAISVANNMGKGCTFTLIIPAV